MAAPRELAFEAFGVRMLLSTNSQDVFDSLEAVLPPTSRPCSSSAIDYSLSLLANDAGTYDVEDASGRVASGYELSRALRMVETSLRARVAVDAPSMVFVHAGVVGHRGRTIVMPGQSFAGKSTLVQALVQAGAVYFSDEFAVIDADGLVHPYAKPLSLRDRDAVEQTDHHVERLGGIVGDRPLPLGAVVMTSYRPEARWNPERLSPGRGVLALAQFTVPVRVRPEQVIKSLTRAVADATVLASDRGDAVGIAEELLELLER